MFIYEYEDIKTLKVGLNTIFVIMGKFHDFGKIQFRLSRPKLSLNWETGNLPK